MGLSGEQLDLVPCDCCGVFVAEYSAPDSFECGVVDVFFNRECVAFTQTHFLRPQRNKICKTLVNLWSSNVV